MAVHVAWMDDAFGMDPLMVPQDVRTAAAQALPAASQPIYLPMMPPLTATAGGLQLLPARPYRSAWHFYSDATPPLAAAAGTQAATYLWPQAGGMHLWAAAPPQPPPSLHPASPHVGGVGPHHLQLPSLPRDIMLLHNAPPLAATTASSPAPNEPDVVPAAATAPSASKSTRTQTTRPRRGPVHPTSTSSSPGDSTPLAAAAAAAAASPSIAGAPLTPDAADMAAAGSSSSGSGAVAHGRKAPTARSGLLCGTCKLRAVYCKGYCRSCYEKLPATKAKTRERHQRYNRSQQGRSRIRRFRARKAAAEALVLAGELGTTDGPAS